MHRLAIRISPALLFSLASVAAYAQSSPSPATGQPAQVTTAVASKPLGEPVVSRIPGTPASQQGMVVVRDAATGQLRAPNAAEWARIAPHLEPLERSPEGLEEIRYDNGTVGVRLGNRYQSFSVLRRDQSGVHHGSCTTSPQALVDLITGAPAPAAAKEVSDVR